MTSLLVLSALVVATAGPASAHAEIIGSAPQPNSIVADLSTVAAQFILVESATLTLLGPDGQEVPPTSDSVMEQLTVTRSFEPPTEPGRYEVRWVALGIDGDTVEGRFFTTLDPDLGGDDLSGSQTAIGLLVTSLIAAAFFMFLIRRGRSSRGGRNDT